MAANVETGPTGPTDNTEPEPSALKRLYLYRQEAPRFSDRVLDELGLSDETDSGLSKARRSEWLRSKEAETRHAESSQDRDS